MTEVKGFMSEYKPSGPLWFTVATGRHVTPNTRCPV